MSYGIRYNNNNSGQSEYNLTEPNLTNSIFVVHWFSSIFKMYEIIAAIWYKRICLSDNNNNGKYHLHPLKKSLIRKLSIIRKISTAKEKTCILFLCPNPNKNDHEHTFFAFNLFYSFLNFI